MSLNLDLSDDPSEPQPVALPNHPAATAAPTARRLGRPCQGNPTLRGASRGRRGCCPHSQHAGPLAVIGGSWHAVATSARAFREPPVSVSEEPSAEFRGRTIESGKVRSSRC